MYVDNDDHLGNTTDPKAGKMALLCPVHLSFMYLQALNHCLFNDCIKPRKIKYLFFCLEENLYFHF